MGNSFVSPMGPFEVFKVLLQGRIIELLQEIDRDRGIVATNVIDELTFVHRTFTFARKTALRPAPNHAVGRVLESDIRPS